MIKSKNELHTERQHVRRNNDRTNEATQEIHKERHAEIKKARPNDIMKQTMKKQRNKHI